MLLDKFGNPIFQDRDIFNMFYKGQLEYLDQIYTEKTPDILKLFDTLGITNKELDPYENKEFFDQANQCDWFIPKEYKTFPIVDWLYEQCKSQEEKDRVEEELTAFVKHNMFDMLVCLKYIVDTLRKHNIVWGVGRGSSVASYILYLIGIHRINSLKYNLDWQEFLR